MYSGGDAQSEIFVPTFPAFALNAFHSAWVLVGTNTLTPAVTFLHVFHTFTSFELHFCTANPFVSFSSHHHGRFVTVA